MRTWEDNKRAINQLWPQCIWTDEERSLWHDDLLGLDQPTLYDAIRNVKRNNDSLYPQLKWIREEYRHLHRLRTVLSTRKTAEQRVVVDIDKEQNERMREELKVLVELATPADYQRTVDIVADKAAKLQVELGTATKLVNYLNDRLGLTQGGKVV